MEQQSTEQSLQGDSVRIYRDGMSEQGTVVTMEELEAMLSDGRLSGHDLIFHDGGWRPLDSVFEIQGAMEEPQKNDSEEELALELKALPSVLDVGGAAIDAGQPLIGGAGGGKKKSPWIAICVCAVVVILLLVAWMVLKG
ncbi:MAG: hypothetical protein IKP58_01765 [Victivallales bacterium]|nr:hypothetical protein [Victivallales bacterium]